MTPSPNSLSFPYAAIFFFLILCLMPSCSQGAELLVYAGAGLRQPVEKLSELFEEKTGHRVLINYDGSGRLMAAILASGRGDLFLPGSLLYIDALKRKGLIHSHREIVAHTPVVAVSRNSSHKVASIMDLAKPGIRIALGDPKAMAFGKMTVKIIKKAGIKDDVRKNIVVYGATVKQLALYVAQGDVDASIIGHADAFQYRDRIKVVKIPDELFDPETIAIAVLTCATKKQEAIQLRDFFSANQAKNIFYLSGFLPLGTKRKIEKIQ